MNKPLVSIIIPVYNNELFLAQCIQSALQQTWERKEIIIINDGSTDNSLTIAKRYEKEGVKVISQVNKGASSARNLGLIHSNGELIQFLDGDDFLSKNKIEEQVLALNKQPNKIAFCATLYFYNYEDPFEKNVVEEWQNKNWNNPIDFLTKLYMDSSTSNYGGMVQPNSWLTPISLINKVGNWNEELSVDDDGEFFCRIILASDGLIYSKNGLNYYRQLKNGNNLSNRKSLVAFQSKVKSIELKHKYLRQRSNSFVIDQIIGRFYWENGILSFPNFRELSSYCLKQAKNLNYKNSKYPGGRTSNLINKYVGWRITRLISYSAFKLKNLINYD